MGRKYFYVDEAGDTTLFDRRGRIIVGDEGVSRTFIIAFAEIADPIATRAALDALRQSLLTDPYFRGVPSMQPQAGKTAVCFHAKDDLPEVRREVFKLLPQLGVKVRAALRRKEELAREARQCFAMGQRLTESDIYDDLVKRIAKNVMHLGEETEVCFARRGKSSREDALHAAIERGKENFKRKWREAPETKFLVRSSVPSADAGLQVVDYYLWALQRFYERGEDRYFNLVADGFGLIMDLDDKRKAGYGEWYSAKNPLTLAKTKPLGS